MIQITFLTNQGKVATAPENSNLLRVSLREQGGIPFKCGGGLCGTCKCRIESGREHTDDIKAKERKLISADELEEGYRLACQTFVQGDIAVSWEPRTPARSGSATAAAESGAG
ncbi:2Fe-2S iron-sulfur cluster-binding protein [Cupriavidus sp. AU9028]|uniref:2Fe-2S iron-sulfur cluster-binding protein n=1 Tax=Cupriavidus sp. AU9028 TaxID=2871157 RepID=UPI001C97C998|nr:2Fe-2S iron-sulfur cluster-binding protein [Cupriavidus sp. AU9028]MBY4899074.1 (2Fe-2S)-binding protein [Cupriavidus sp. AU9028]